MKEKEFEIEAFYLASFRKILREHLEFQMDATGGYDLSPNEIAVLSSLDSKTTASQIAADFEVSKALVSRSVKLLRQKELISVAVSKTDRREQDLTLSEKGKYVADCIKAADRKFFGDMTKSLSEDYKNMLRLMLKLMLRDIEQGGKKR